VESKARIVKILITGIAGFVGSTLARELLGTNPNISIVGLDNFIRPGSENNRLELKKLGVQIFHGDIRSQSDLETLPAVDAVIDAAANPSVLAGVDGKTSSIQLIEHNLLGTVNLLEFCKAHNAAFVLLSTSRVYSIPGLSEIQVAAKDGGFVPIPDQNFPDGISEFGVSESYSTMAPVSLYGATKVASEVLSLEYGETFDFPVWINRCGVLAGEGQFGRPDQGIFSFWINAYLRRMPLKYIGFGGNGHQVRDCLHPKDLVPVILKQLHSINSTVDRICNFSGGIENSMSLAQLSDWCSEKCGPHEVGAEGAMRPFDIPWMVLDSRKAMNLWDWAPVHTIDSILSEILEHAKEHPDWLELSKP
jgi:CDP-paratose 2-epimerase